MLENVEVPEGLNKEVLEHLMYPRNYGKLEDANGIGVAVDEQTGEYVIMYLKISDTAVIEDIKFATNGCQDTVVVGSMFSEMIKGQNDAFANTAIQKLYQKLGNDMTKKQRVCADMVLTAYIAATKNFNNIQDGKNEEMHVLKMKESCEIEESEDE